jgi:hypothetical protein
MAEQSKLDEFLLKVQRLSKALRDPDRLQLKLGDEPGSHCPIAAFHPDRPSEPVIWWSYLPGMPSQEMDVVLRKSFVLECLEGRLKCEDDPAAVLASMLLVDVLAQGLNNDVEEHF